MSKYIIVFITLSFIFFQGFSQKDINPNGYNIFYFENGQKSSEGYFENGKPVGYWKNYFENGVLKSEGNRKNAQLDSVWLFYYGSGLLKESITFQNSKKEGTSKFYSEEGNLKSEFQYHQDTIVGVSLHYFDDLNRVQFEKPYENGILSGIGYEYARDGRIINLINYQKGVVASMQSLNRYDQKNRKTGLWITYHENTGNEKIKMLEGRYTNGLKNGYFREYDKKGVQISTTKYVNGEVIENAEELMSVDLVRDYYPNASVHWEKTYIGSVPHGIWKEFDSTGVIISSVIYQLGVKVGSGILDGEGVKQGPWEEFYTTGELRAKGNYIDGARVGKWEFYHINGKIEQKGKYKAGGKPHGTWYWYYEDGSLLREETFINGKEDGEMIEYTPSGDVLAKGEYMEGLKEGPWEINAGDYIEKGNYVEGMMEGVWIGIYKINGKTAFQGAYIEDEPNGKHTYYYPSGKKRLEGKYQLGVKVGDWKRYGEDGLLLLTIRYNNGVVERLNGKKVKNYSKD